MIIYRATNLINGKIYIGKTEKRLSVRKSQHLSFARNGSNIYFHKAISKYGSDNFRWDVIEECLFGDVLIEREKHYISFFDSRAPRGYNLTEGGDGLINPSDDLRRRISESNKGKHNHSPQTIEKMSLANRGKRLADEQKRYLSEINSGEKHPMYGRHHSIQTKKKMSDAKRGIRKKPTSDETKRKLSIACSNPSLEARVKMSLAAKNYWRKIHGETERQAGK